MERLTKQWGSNPAVPCNINYDFLLDLDQETADGLQAIIDRLAAYEDTGMEPEGIKALNAELEQAKRERDAAIADLTESGPCFACKNFKRNAGNCVGGELCLEEMLKCDSSAQEYTGPEWEWRGINTREEAETALKGGEG